MRLKLQPLPLIGFKRSGHFGYLGGGYSAGKDEQQKGSHVQAPIIKSFK